MSSDVLPELSDAARMRLWEQSTRLRDAFYVFTHESTRNNYRCLSEVAAPSVRQAKFWESLNGSLQKVTEAPRAENPTWAPFIEVINKAFASSKVDHAEDFDLLEKQLKEKCLRRLQRGELVGLGFDAPRKVSDVPSVIPRDVFWGITRWDKGKLSHGSIDLEEVRVTLPEGLQTIDAQVIEGNPLTAVDGCSSSAGSSEIGLEARPEGRPSHKALVRETFEKCDDSREIDRTQIKKIAHEVVMRYIRKFHPDQYKNGEGFGYDAFIKNTKDLWDKT